jgi:Helix-turn-helix domain
MTPPAEGRWFRVQEMVVDLYGAEMGPEAAWIYTCLARYASWDSGECWPSHPTLRAVSGMALPRVRKALTRLEALGLIASEERRMAVGGVVRWRKVYTLLDPSPAAVMERRRARQRSIAPHHGRIGKPRPPRRPAQPEVSSDTAQVFREQIVQGTEKDPEPFGEQFVPDSGNNLCTKQDLRERDANPEPRARDVYPPARGQSGTSPDPAILPEKPHAPDVQEGCSVGRPPPAAALVQGAAQPEAPASVEEEEPPAPEQPAVSVLPCTEAVARPEAPAKPLAVPQAEVAGQPRAVGACVPAAPPPTDPAFVCQQDAGEGAGVGRHAGSQQSTPPEFGPSYVPQWSPPREVGARGLPAWLLACEMVRKYGMPLHVGQKEFAHA